MTTYDRDDLIRRAIEPDETVRTPADLGDLIYRTIRETPQRRSMPRFLQLGWLPSPSPALALLALLALLIVGLAVAALARPPSSPALLTMYHGGPDRTGVMPGPGPAGDLVLDWEAQRHGAIGFTVMPLVADGRVFVADDGGFLAALDETTGVELWEYDAGSPIRASPVLVGDLVIIATEDGSVAAFAASNGRERWRTSLPGPVSAALAAVDTDVLVASELGTLYVLDARSGDERWSIEVGGPATRGPSIAAGVIYIGTSDGLIQAVDRSSHRVIWTGDFGPAGISTPALAGRHVFFGHGLDGDPGIAEIVALDALTGDLFWRRALAEGVQFHVGAIDGERVYGVSTDLNVYALDRATGDIVWTYRTGSPNGALAGLVEGTLFVSSSDGTVSAIDTATGDQRWSYRLVGDLTIPVVVNGRVIVGTSLGQVVAIGGSESP